MSTCTTIRKILLGLALGALWTAAQAAAYTYRIPVPALTVSSNAPTAPTQYALNFPGGSSDAVAMGPLSNIDFSNGFSVLVDFYPTGITSVYGSMLFNKEDTFEVTLMPQYELEYAVNCTSSITWTWVDTGVAVPPNQWASVAMSYVSSTGAVAFALNGNTIYQGTACSGVYPQNTQATLGNRTHNSPQPFEGKMKRFALWNAPVPGSALTNLTAGASVTGYTKGLQVYYPFTEGAGAALSDQSGNGNNGTLQGSVTWTTP